MSKLQEAEVLSLIRKVFLPQPMDKRILVLTDVPNSEVPDTDSWCDRRLLANELCAILRKLEEDLAIDGVELIYYENCGSHNAQLPEMGVVWDGDARDARFPDLSGEGRSVTLVNKLSRAQIVFALTQFSASAPLKLLAKELGFRAASMPGFNRGMIPALGIDYERVHERVMIIKSKLDQAQSLQIQFGVGDDLFALDVDLRWRLAHASSGLIREPGTAWNLPSGEAFIVPYEGERGEKSKTTGLLPVQYGREIVVYQIQDNRASAVTSEGEKSEAEATRLRVEPAYGNIAEIGFGVLKSFGVKPVGEMLLDEKLGLHIAFGRSDHFGGFVSPADFKESRNVVHYDHVYIPEVQNQIEVLTVVLGYPDGAAEVLIKNGEYLV